MSVSIQAQRSRRRYIPKLQEALGPVPVAWSEARNPNDPKQRDVWATRKRAMRLAHPKARFHLVVQDDAVVGKDFYGRLGRILEAHGDIAYSLYYRHKTRQPQFVEAAVRGREAGGFLWPRLTVGVGVVLPTAIISDLMAFCDGFDMPKPGGGEDDVRMSRYLEAEGIPVFYTLPSLIDHRSGITGWHGPNHYRRAWLFE